MSKSKKTFWIYWLIITIGLAGYLTIQLTGEDKSAFLPGKTSHGHYQIEAACSACHSDPFGGGEVLQDACTNCHGQELNVADDSHPKSKFTNPRNADRLEKLDARQCVTCHMEHKEEITQDMGVTLPDDFCFKCHFDVAENRPSHKGMEFSSCASAGCHNYHDNRGLYEDFLAKHLDEPEHHVKQDLKPLSLEPAYHALAGYPIKRYPAKELKVTEADIPLTVRDDPKIKQDWMDTSHRQSGVNCTACHEQQAEDSTASVWVDKPDHKACASCHSEQAKSFLDSKHGMRLKQDLSPMTPGHTGIDMKKTAHTKELNCVSCHGAHRFDRQHAAVEACIGCHDDKHTNAYKQSPHYNTWLKEINSGSKENVGVSCATCHLPRKPVKYESGTFIIAEHNQNDNLRPNEKMLRSVCMQCHGLGFSIDALADRDLIDKNFSGKPGLHVESLDLVKKRLNLKKDIQGM